MNYHKDPGGVNDVNVLRLKIQIKQLAQENVNFQIKGKIYVQK